MIHLLNDNATQILPRSLFPLVVVETVHEHRKQQFFVNTFPLDTSHMFECTYVLIPRVLSSRGNTKLEVRANPLHSSTYCRVGKNFPVVSLRYNTMNIILLVNFHVHHKPLTGNHFLLTLIACCTAKKQVPLSRASSVRQFTRLSFPSYIYCRAIYFTIIVNIESVFIIYFLTATSVKNINLVKWIHFLINFNNRNIYRLRQCD